MSDERTSGWVFDKPLYADGLFWVCVTVGVALAAFETASESFGRLSVGGQLLSIAVRFVVGMFVAGVAGGAIRNFVRAYRQG